MTENNYRITDICATCGDTYGYHSAHDNFCPNHESEKPHFVETVFEPSDMTAIEIDNVIASVNKAIFLICYHP